LKELLLLAAVAVAGSPGQINAYVTPYYNSSGPVVNVGSFSSGLASKDPKRFVATIVEMKKEWHQLDFLELYAGAIRLYDLGYRKEATYWFYTAQYAGRQFALLVDQSKMGGIGARGFELYHAQDAFFELTGPDINGYAFGDIDWLVTVIRKVQRANQSIGDLHRIYPHVVFVSKGQWQRTNAQLNAGLGKLATTLQAQKSEIQVERVQDGSAVRFSQLSDKQFPGGF
jgi:hypothetical protein